MDDKTRSSETHESASVHSSSSQLSPDLRASPTYTTRKKSKLDDILSFINDSSLNQVEKRAMKSAVASIIVHEHGDSPMDDLPAELLLKIFGYLDLSSKCRVAHVSRSWKALAYDSSLFTDVNLSSYRLPNVALALEKLSWRCQRLRYLNVSELKDDRINLAEFMEKTGSRLTHLNAARTRITSLPDCSDLIELDITASTDLPIGSGGYGNLLACRHLRKLQISWSNIHEDALIPVLKNNPMLEHLDMYYCATISDMNLVMKALANHNPLLNSLSVVGNCSLSARGIDNIAHLIHLRDLDICYTRCEFGDSLKNVFMSCRQLTKLGLRDCKHLTYSDLSCLADHSSNLIHLDIISHSVINKDICQRFLINMPHLKELHVSMCAISRDEMLSLQDAYPNVQIH